MQQKIQMQIDPLSDISLYEQIIEQLKQAIITGELEEHSLLPSVRGLAQALGVSVITTRRAYVELERLGYVITLPAKGTFVSYRYRERVTELARVKLNELLSDAAYLAQALDMDESALLEQLASHYQYAKEHEYNQQKARQIISQFVRNL